MGKLFNNATNLVFDDISSEQERTYTFPGDHKITIFDPQKLNVSRSGGHRIFDGVKSHYIPSGWIHLEWVARVGEPDFVK